MGITCQNEQEESSGRKLEEGVNKKPQTALELVSAKEKKNLKQAKICTPCGPASLTNFGAVDISRTNTGGDKFTFEAAGGAKLVFSEESLTQPVSRIDPTSGATITEYETG